MLTLGRLPAGRVVGQLDPARSAVAARMVFGFPWSRRPDAVIGNNYMAVRVLDTLRLALGLRVPETVVVCGFDNPGVAELPTYEFMSYKQRGADIGDGAVATLDGKIAETLTTAEQRVLQRRLEVRGSTRRWWV